MSFLTDIMAVLTSRSTPFQIWYEDLLNIVVRHIQKDVNYVLQIQQAKAKYGDRFNPNLFQEDVECLCRNNKLRACCVCRGSNIYVVPL